MVITSSKNEQIKVLMKLKNKKGRDATSSFLVEGEHLVEEALKKSVVIKLIKKESYHGNLNFENELIVTDEIFKKIASTKTPQGIMALCHYIVEAIDLLKARKLLILDNLQDPGNVGTLIRTASAFDFDGILFSNHSVDYYNEKVINASQGAFFKMALYKGDIVEEIKKMKMHNFFIVGTSLKDACSLNDYNFNQEKVALVLGNEGNGMSKETYAVVDKSLYIPISNKVESLNVAIAGAIVMHKIAYH